jgi:hypothetical protein
MAGRSGSDAHKEARRRAYTSPVTHEPSRSRPALWQFLVVLVGLVVGVALVAVAGLALLVYDLRDPPDERPEVATFLYQDASRTGQGGTIDLGIVAPFEWDRMYAFSAYTDDAWVSEVLGFPWGTGATLRMPSEQFVLLIFADGERVTGWTMLNDYESTEPHIYFERGLYETPIARDNATFRLRGDTLARTQ